MRQELHREKQRVDNVFSLVDDLDIDEEVISHWAKYLCILTSGLLENSIRIIVAHYSLINSNPCVASYVRNSIERVTNLNTEKIRQLLGAFSKDWGKIFENSISEEQKDAIDSIYANRNSIVHGRSVGITLVRIKDYYKNIHEVLDWICNECVLI
jgi:hypothetical protein